MAWYSGGELDQESNRYDDSGYGFRHCGGPRCTYGNVVFSSADECKLDCEEFDAASLSYIKGWPGKHEGRSVEPSRRARRSPTPPRRK